MSRPFSFPRDFPVPLHIMQSELARLLGDYLNPPHAGTSATPPTDLESPEWVPAVDLTENPDEFLIQVEVPGVDPAAIDLSVTGDVLNLRGTKVDEVTTEAHRPLRERRFGSFHRQITLSKDVDFDAVEAELRHGVLRVRLPKRRAAMPRTIPVQHN
jgi:HSP20 family protein